MFLTKNGDRTCPVRSISLSNSLTAVWPEWWLATSSQPDTSTDGVDVKSLTREPGLKDTVLAHSDLAVETSGLHLTSSGAGHNFRSSTCTSTIGFCWSHWMPTMWPVAWRTTWLGPIHGNPIYVEPPVGRIATPTIQLGISGSLL